MSATNHTQNYDLSQFVGGDIPSWLGDYNGDMSKIDAAISGVAQGAGDTSAAVTALTSRMTAAETDIDTAESNIATLQATQATQGAAIQQNTGNIATNANNITSLDGRVTALEQAGSGATVLTATLTAGQTTVSFANAAITASSYIDIYTADGTSYTNAVQTVGNLTITFDAQVADLAVAIVVRDFT